MTHSSTHQQPDRGLQTAKHFHVTTVNIVIEIS